MIYLTSLNACGFLNFKGVACFGLGRACCPGLGNTQFEGCQSCKYPFKDHE